ncbi:uncharacterized protein ACNLHF_016312 isoform 2-T2 [Anomaloglossus baeobatrachus]|uniref:uncharacterized protein LOC142301938 isoform X2 n=1 Tax=Anomaloglossus baeobatrachus TaxID=238106 RepID=UPI003F4F9F45
MDTVKNYAFDDLSLKRAEMKNVKDHTRKKVSTSNTKLQAALIILIIMFLILSIITIVFFKYYLLIQEEMSELKNHDLASNQEMSQLKNHKLDPTREPIQYQKCNVSYYKYYAMETELEKVKEQNKRHLTMGSFLLYNEAHNKCAEVHSPSAGRDPLELTASVCSSVSDSQLFHWLPGGRLMSLGEGLCVVVEGKPQSQMPLRLSQCNADNTLSWECYNNTLLGVKGENLFFNYGNNPKNIIMLFSGYGIWSRWRARNLDGNVLDGGACAQEKGL